LKFARRIIIAIAVLALLIAVVRLMMPFAARRLIHSDPLVRSDLIVVLGSLRVERTIEAGMLFREGWAPRILLLRPPDMVRDSLRQQLGIHVPVFLDIQKDVLVQMGVPASAIAVSPRTQDSTRREAAAIAEYARAKRYRRVIVVTSPYHTGRTEALLGKAANGSLQTIIRATRFETAEPTRWWRRFPDRSEVVYEYLSTIYSWFWR